MGSDTQKEQFIMAILYGSKYSDFSTAKTAFEKNLKIVLNENGIYGRINGKVKESIGIYYQEESGNAGEGTEESNVPDANKTEKRVITYTSI